MNRYVILEHTHRGRHWDFMLEWYGVLRTWALAEQPSVRALIEARRLADHRLAYLDYEGPISGGRGEVTRWDRGEYELNSDEIGKLVVTLSGGRLTGRVTLIARGAAGESDGLWTFCCDPADK